VIETQNIGIRYNKTIYKSENYKVEQYNETQYIILKISIYLTLGLFFCNIIKIGKVKKNMNLKNDKCFRCFILNSKYFAIYLANVSDKLKIKTIVFGFI
jgi:hypothetical protein